jgi:hypothetical protein
MPWKIPEDTAARLTFYRDPSAAQKAAGIDPAKSPEKGASPPSRRTRLV